MTKPTWLISLAFLVGAFALNSILAHSADVVKSASVFESAEEASKQVLILRKGQKAQVTGPSVDRDDRSWLPITAGGKTGWVGAEALNLSEDDVGYVKPVASTPGNAVPKFSRSRFWVGAGPTVMSTSSYTFNTSTYPGTTFGGVALSGAIEGLLGPEGRYILGFRFLFPWVSETSPGAQGFGAGRLSRYIILPGFGYAIIPHKLELMGHFGLALIRGESIDFESKFSLTPGLTLAWQLTPAEPGVRYQAIELGAFRMQEATQSAGDIATFGITSSLCTGLGTAFGSSNPSAGCTRGVAPTAYVFTLLYKLGL
jgi:hypothetical protein